MHICKSFPPLLFFTSYNLKLVDYTHASIYTCTPKKILPAKKLRNSMSYFNLGT